MLYFTHAKDVNLELQKTFNKNVEITLWVTKKKEVYNTLPHYSGPYQIG